MPTKTKKPVWLTQVLAYDLQDQILADVQKAAASLKMTVHETNISTDILAIGACISICDFSRMPLKKQKEVISWFEEMSVDHDFRVMFIPSLKIRTRRYMSKTIIRTPDIVDVQSLRMIMLNTSTAQTRRGRSRDVYDTKLKRLFHEVRTLRDNGKAYTRDLCGYLGVTPRTIQRDMNLLDDMGELINYDKHKKMYVYEGSVSDI